MSKIDSFAVKKISCSENDGDTFECTFHVDRELDYFKGHFEEIHLLPGVVQLHFLDFILKNVVNDYIGIQKATVIKNLKPVIPGDLIRYVVNVKDKKVIFEIFKIKYDKEICVTEGKIVLC